MVLARNVLQLFAGSPELMSVENYLVDLLRRMHRFLNSTGKEKGTISQALREQRRSRDADWLSLWKHFLLFFPSLFLSLLDIGVLPPLAAMISVSKI